MSAETKAALDAAIQAHVASEGEEGTELMVSHYILLVTQQDFAKDNGYTGYRYWASAGSPAHVTFGLIDTITTLLKNDFLHGHL